MKSNVNAQLKQRDSALVRENLGFLLQLAHRRIQRELNQELLPSQLEARHMAVLALIRDHPLTQRGLIDRLEIDKSSAVYIVDDLERLGLATREPDANDRRANAVQITRKGRKFLADGLKIVQRVQSRAVNSFTAADIASLRDLLNRLLENLPNASPRQEVEKEN
ncbi:MAG: MarR family transcriptional regulator [Candidatus Sulfotelmatobacter sp.]